MDLKTDDFVIVAVIVLCFVGTVSNSPTEHSLGQVDNSLGGQESFLKSVIERSSPANARLVAELFHGLDLGHSPNTVVRVGGAATLCHHQSPCYDPTCDLCYDPLLQQHGLCGGGSYYTCQGSLPQVCLPQGEGEERCQNSPGIYGRSPRNQYSLEREPVLVKQFSRHMDYFCLGQNRQKRLSTDVNQSLLPEGVLEVGAAVSVCQKYDKCLDLSCAHRPVACYDAYIGGHVACGDLSHFQCKELLPRDCLPVRCTETSVKQIFKEGENEEETLERSRPLLVRSFPPIADRFKVCE